MVRSKDSKGFSGRNRKFKQFFRPKTGDLQKTKKRSSSQKRHEIRCQSTKNQFGPRFCTPVAPSLLISSGHCPRLGGHNFRLGGTSSHLGGTAPVCPPVAPGLWWLHALQKDRYKPQCSENQLIHNHFVLPMSLFIDFDVSLPKPGSFFRTIFGSAAFAVTKR